MMAIDRIPRPRRRDRALVPRVVPLIMGGIAVALFLLDPDRGRIRRARLRDQAARLARVAPDALSVTGRDTANRLRGVAAVASGAFRRESVNDVVLEERVRSALGRAPGHVGAVDVRAADGRITLSGAVLTTEADEFLRAAAAVAGVRDVEDALDRHDTPGHIPDLQGERRQPEPRPDVLQRQWAPATRLAAVVAGTGAAITGLMVRGPVGLFGVVTGGLVALRGLTNLQAGWILGLRGGRQSLNVHKTIQVDAPPEAAFALWSRFEDFPRFMSHVRSVERRGDDTSHWTVAGPAGLPVEFDAEVTKYVPNEVIAWKSVEGEPVRHAGIVQFEPRRGGRTRITVRMTYNPVGGLLAHGIASLLGADPKHALDEDLVRFKSLLEHGKTSAHGQETRLEEVMPEVGVSAS
jgi:uncharacterized membrane protein